MSQWFIPCFLFVHLLWTIKDRHLPTMLAPLCLLSFAASAMAGTIMPCICTMEYMPVCGVDGKTYGNKCDLNCAGVAEAHPGECAAVCPCPKIYDPVCGQDGKTYSNKCMLNCAGVALFQEGACSASSAGGVQADPVQLAGAEPCICTFIYWPVCGTNGITYGNDCNRLCAGAALSHEGPCLGSPSTTKAGPVA